MNVHEAGAIEYTGHKVLALPAVNGKLEAKTVAGYIQNFYEDENHEHMVFPGMVYLSFPTEYGTLYSKAELEALYRVCREANIPLFIDGARLGYGLASPANDISLPELKKLFAEKGYEFYIDSPTNQQFIILPNDKMEELSQRVVFSFWEKLGEDKTVVRFATSWSTTDKDMEELAGIL